MIRRFFLGLLLATGMAACASNDSGSGSPADSGPDASGDAAGDVANEAGPCAPLGTWLLHYSGDAGPPPDESILIEAGSGPAEVQVTFLDRVPEKDACSAPSDSGTDGQAEAGPEHITATGTIDAASCTLAASFSQSWCQSGEDQCQSWSWSLVLSGSTGSGSASETGGWCLDKKTRDYLVSAQKQ